VRITDIRRADVRARLRAAGGHQPGWSTDGYPLPHDVLARIINVVDGITWVSYHVSSEPATIGYE
jgi:GMP synthase PP-ATPase subunit